MGMGQDHTYFHMYVCTHTLGLLVDSEIDLSTRNVKARVFVNKTLSTETAYQQDVINRDRLSTRLIVGKLGQGMRCCKVSVLLMYWCVRHKGKCIYVCVRQ
jgi:hypothetical protein